MSRGTFAMEEALLARHPTGAPIASALIPLSKRHGHLHRHLHLRPSPLGSMTCIHHQRWGLPWSLRGAPQLNPAQCSLLISNLDSGVSNEDLLELFSEIADLKQYSINYDSTGRSKGTAEVVFARHADALAAVQRYDTVQLDGRPMKIEIVGLHIQAPVTLVPPVIAPSPFTRGLGNRNMNAHASRGFGGGSLSVGGGFVAGARGRSQGGNFSASGGVGSGKGKRSDQVLISADDLDADLERYRASGRHTR